MVIDDIIIRMEVAFSALKKHKAYMTEDDMGDVKR